MPSTGCPHRPASSSIIASIWKPLRSNSVNSHRVCSPAPYIATRRSASARMRSSTSSTCLQPLPRIRVQPCWAYSLSASRRAWQMIAPIRSRSDEPSSICCALSSARIPSPSGSRLTRSVASRHSRWARLRFARSSARHSSTRVHSSTCSAGVNSGCSSPLGIRFGQSSR